MFTEKYPRILGALLLGAALLTPACATTEGGENSAPQVVSPGTALPAASVDLDAVKKGKRLYAMVCARCHGLNMVLTGESTFNLREFPLDQKERFVESVTKGKRAMPAWGGIVSPEEIEVLWAYINTRGVL